MEGGPEDGKLVALGTTTTMGRESDNDLVVPEAQVSRNHAEIVLTEQGYCIRDLSNTNGTFVNRQRVTEQDFLLKEGDRINLGAGQYTLIFGRPGAVPAEPPRTAAAPAEPATAEAAAEAAEEPAEKEPAVAVPTGVMPAVAEPEAPAEAVAAELPQTGLAKLLQRLRLQTGLRFGKKPAAEPKPEEEEEPALAPLTLPAQLIRAARNVREAVEYKLRPRTLTLSIERGVIRAVILQGQEVLAWGIADPEDAAASADGAPAEKAGNLEEGEVARTRSLLSGLRGERARVISGLPLYTPLIRHIRLPEIRRRYLNDVVASEVVGSIPFGRDEVDVKWQLVASEDPNSVMAIAVQRRVIDDHVQQLKDSNGAPGATYSQAAALAIAAGVRDAVIVHVGPATAAIVLVRDNTPRAEHQIMISGEDQSVQAQADAIAKAAEQMDGLDQSLGGREEGEPLPIILTGRTPQDGELRKELQTALQRDLLPVSPPLTWPEEFPVDEYAANLGLAILDRGRPKWWRQVPQKGSSGLSLLSERHLPTPIPFIPVAAFLAIALLGVTAFNLTPSVEERVLEASDSAARLDEREGQARVYKLESSVATRLQNQARDVRQLTLEIKSRLSELQEEMDALAEWFHRIETISAITAACNVTKVSLPGLAPKSQDLQLSGSAETLADAIRYANSIRDSGLFTGVVLRQVGSKEGRVSLGSLEGVAEEGAECSEELKGDGGPQVLQFVIDVTTREKGEDSEEAPE